MEHDEDFGLRSWWFRAFAAIVVPLACVGVLVVLVPGLPSAWKGYRGNGEIGTLTVTHESCGKGGCSYSGDFVSDDGTRHLTEVGVSGLFHEVGDEVRAYYTGDDEGVYVKGGADLFIAGLGVFVAGAYLVGWIAWLREKARPRGHGARTS